MIRVSTVPWLFPAALVAVVLSSATGTAQRRDGVPALPTPTGRSCSGRPRCHVFVSSRW